MDEPEGGPKKLFVLDTNVLIHDPSSMFRFEEHDVYLPMLVLEELDRHKHGLTEVARNARQASRYLDELVHDQALDVCQGVPLPSGPLGLPSGKLYLQVDPSPLHLPEGMSLDKPDNQILAVVLELSRRFGQRPVILVSKDINMRIKARTLGLLAEDYFNDQVIQDTDLLYTGTLELSQDFFETHKIKRLRESERAQYAIEGPLVESFYANEFLYGGGEKPFCARVRAVEGGSAFVEEPVDYSLSKNNVWGICARNQEQNFALNLLMDQGIDFVTLLGQAGTGKTLLALAAGLTQVIDKKLYDEIIMTRATVPVGEDIGFLPGNEEEKMIPWMGALEDNLEVLQQMDGGLGEWGRSVAKDFIRHRIKVKSMSFMRGRTFLNKIVVVDEAQNLTPKQMKTLITRSGPGTKVICLGNIAQIDTPYLTEASSGLTYAVDRFKGWPHNGHVTLTRGERSRLADFAERML